MDKSPLAKIDSGVWIVWVLCASEVGALHGNMGQFLLPLLHNVAHDQIALP
eukprot:SAG31_NODE_1985_length_6715_cov_6.562924_8_plen_51_part_00